MKLLLARSSVRELWLHVESGMFPVNLFPLAVKETIKGGRFGGAPSKQLRDKSKKRSDEFTKTSGKPWKPLRELLKKVAEKRRG